MLGARLGVLAILCCRVAADCGCTPDETCCKDDSGYACCVVQSTFCAPPNASSTKNFPARCCPQWTVGCEAGSVGCCDPAHPWQRALSSNKIKAIRPVSSKSLSAPASLTVFALFSSGVASDLNCLTIDSENGHISALKPVKGPAQTYFGKLYGEETREYPFDPSRGKFFFLDIVQQGASASSPITLYGIDPATGESTSSVVSGATGNVVSYVYHAESAALIFATGFREDSQFSFYSLDLDSAKATFISTEQRGASESSSPAYYSPYMTAVASSGKEVLRLGYEQVVVAEGPGLGITPLGGNGTAVWHTVPSVTDEEFFYSLTRVPGADKFVSLAPSQSANHTLAVVSWDISGDAPEVILDVPDAHPPSSPGTGILGYVTDTVSAGFYAGLVVKKGVLPVGLGDRWEVLTVDLSALTGGSAVLSGHGFDVLGAETVSVSGIGVKKN